MIVDLDGPFIFSENIQKPKPKTEINKNGIYSNYFDTPATRCTDTLDSGQKDASQILLHF